MPMLTILGPVEVPGADVDRPQQRAVLAYLLLRAGEQVSSTQLIDAVWADRAPSSARTQVHSAISRLRRVLADSGVPVRIVSKAGGYLVEAPPEAVDLTVFRAGVREARLAAEDARSADAADTLHQVLQLWRGEALSGINAAFATSAQELLHQERLDAQELWARCQLDLDRADEVVPVLAELAATEPLREGLVAQLMLALYRTGRQAQALELYLATQRRLSEDLGVDPGPELAQAHMTILQAEPANLPVLRTAGGASDITPSQTPVLDVVPITASTMPVPLPPPPRRRTKSVVLALVGVAICSAAIAAITASIMSRPSHQELIPKQLTVFNAESGCAVQTERLRVCSMGLAKTPQAYRTPADVVAHRVWHGDVLTVDCMVTNGIRVQDESGISTTDWFRVRLPDVPSGIAWLPAIRTRDHLVLPLCPTD